MVIQRWKNHTFKSDLSSELRLFSWKRTRKTGRGYIRKGWYVSNELAESFLAHQKSKFIKIGICFLLACVSSVFSYMNMYNNVGDVISTFIIIVAII